MDRRTLVQILAAGVVAESAFAFQHEHGKTEHSGKPYALRFFTPEENETVDRFSEILIPADDESPGAHAVGVSLYLDYTLAAADAERQQQWREGLRALDAAAHARFDRHFRQGPAEQQDQLVAHLAEHEQAPSTDLERFFVIAKRATIEGYCRSQAAIRAYLHYQGDTAVAAFPGCTHPEHQA